MALRHEQQRKTLWRDCGAGTAPHFLPESPAFRTRLRAASRCCRCISSPCCTGSRPRVPRAAGIVQGLVDRFSQDMETVLRELGRKRSCASRRRCGALPRRAWACSRLTRAPSPRERAHWPRPSTAALPDGTANAELSSRALASYLWASVSGARATDLCVLARRHDRVSGGKPDEMRKLPKTAEREPESLPPPISKMLRVDELKDGEERSIEIESRGAGHDRRLLDLVALDDLRFTFRIHRRGEGRLAVSGTLAAAATQTCVVSLEPVASSARGPGRDRVLAPSPDRGPRRDHRRGRKPRHARMARADRRRQDRLRPGHLRDACHRPRSLSRSATG